MTSNSGRGSLPVDNVQSLASKNLNGIPPRYIREEAESDDLLDNKSLQIPVIDMNQLVVGQIGYQDEMKRLHLACQDWGFFHLINHGILEEIEKMKKVTEEFFKLPLEERMLCAQPPNCSEGYGQAFVLSEDQKLDWGDMLYLLPLPVSHRKMNLWPKTPSSFRPTLDEYSATLKELTNKLISLMAENLKADPQKLTAMFHHDGTQGIRMNYYPPCTQPNKVLGIAPHSDTSALTLIQVNEDIHGLQIKKNQQWVPIKPVPGSIIVNIGDAMEIFSNGKYRSIEHRAVVNNEKERISIAAFHSPNLSTDICPLPELVKDNMFKTVSHQDFIKMVFNKTLDGKGLLDQLKL
ncbi:S-norcoclaurine synthase 1-like [Apium graveolens]|uniref:S-norcoclaurine synthase 1-like n=1 Tax=Apium graveolens TaxID=4045 RepID=UPI003D7AE666